MESLQAVVLEQLGRFHRTVSDWELALFAEPRHSPPTLISLCLQLKSWLPGLRTMRGIIHTIQTVRSKQEKGSPSFDAYQTKYLENRMLQELVYGLSFLTLSDLPRDIIDIVQRNHAAALRKASFHHNLTLNLSLTTNQPLRDVFAEAFNSCTSHHLDEFLKSVWTGVLHKRISEDAARDDSALSALAQSQLEDAMPDEERERIHRFRDTLSGFQSAASPHPTGTVSKKAKVSVSSAEIGEFRNSFLCLT